jgi:murein DD-endopeptidase MepM/ murein hydrolase activator NlpD
MEENKNKQFIKRLKNRYRLVIINDKTFEDKISFSLTPLNLFVGFSSFVVFFASIIITLIVFTPLKEFIPGYTDTKTKKGVALLLKKTDSLERALIDRDYYYKTILNILKDETVDTTKDSAPPLKSGETNAKIPTKTVKEKQFVEDFENRKDDYNIAKKKSGTNSIVNFYKPTSGVISKRFDRLNHPGIDIVTQPDQPVKAILDGRVVFSGWTKEAGYVVILQHAGNLMSIYKHNAGILKNYGTFVRAGETISIVGNSGEHTTGPHLHIEVWDNGTPIDPALLFNY